MLAGGDAVCTLCGGISHHPDESVTSDDVALAIRAYLQAIMQVAAGHYPG